MKKFGLILLVLSAILSACDSNEVKIRGKVAGVNGPVKLLAELPGEEGLVVLARQDVTDDNIDLRSEKLTVPARVWVDVNGKKTLEFIADTKDMIWIEGKMQQPEDIEVKGSGLGAKYADVKVLFKDKYEKPVQQIDNSIRKILAKDNQTKDDEVMLGIYQLQKQRYARHRVKYVQTLVETNPTSELSLFLIKDELRDSIRLQKELFKNLKIANKESNVYKLLKQQLQ